MLSVLLVLLAGQEAAQTAVVNPAPVVEAAPQAADDLPIYRPREKIDGFSEAGDAAGHTGRVTVETVVQPDGSKGPVTVIASSRSDLLDAAAIETIAGATIRGRPEASRFQIVVEFLPSDIINMKCDEFARQVRWSQSAWPEAGPKETGIYTMSVGLMAILASQDGAGVEAMLRPAREMEGLWPRILADCERQPNRPYIQVLAGRFR
jgi:TonB family protein